MKAEDFNKKYPIGRKFIYFPVKGDGNGEKTQTRSIAWELGHGETVVKIEGRSGGVAVSHLVPING